MIADDIRKADTAAMVYFLLTAYIDTALSSGKLGSVPESITQLPVRGVADVKSRFEALMLELDAASKRLDDQACITLKEALAICGVALNRLQSLDGKGGWPLNLAVNAGALHVKTSSGAKTHRQDMCELVRPAPGHLDDLLPRV